MFARLSASDPLTQGDILDECPLVGLNVGSAPLDLKDPATKWWPARVIVLTQSCDLSQGKVDSVLVAPVHDAQELVAAGVLKGTVVRDQLRRHLVFGWYFLPAATAPVQMSESLIDLRGPFGSARGARAIGRRRKTGCESRVAFPRAPCPAFRCHLHARGLAGTICDATMKSAVASKSATTGKW